MESMESMGKAWEKHGKNIESMGKAWDAWEKHGKKWDLCK